jgi:hypothetical protein
MSEKRNWMSPQTMPEVPQARTIDARDIRHANGLGNTSSKARRYAKQRIEIYGALNRAFLRSLIRKEPDESRA